MNDMTGKVHCSHDLFAAIVKKCLNSVRRSLFKSASQAKTGFGLNEVTKCLLSGQNQSLYLPKIVKAFRFKT